MRPRLEPRRMTALSDKLVRGSELFVVAAAGLLVIAAVILATVVLFGLFIESFHAHLGTVATIDAVQTAVQNVFAGVLLLMLGLELLETLKLTSRTTTFGPKLFWSSQSLRWAGMLSKPISSIRAALSWLAWQR